MTNNESFDVIIIGGSYAGLSAAMALGRSLKKTLVIDAGQSCNRQTPHSHNFLTQDGKTPKEISDLAKQQVQKYRTIKFYNDFVVDGKKSPEGFDIITQSGVIFQSKKLIFATGIKDKMLDIKGFAECWGISVIHCPYCHGYEVKGKKTAIMSNSDHAFHLASLVNNLTDDLTLLTQGNANFTPDQLEKLKHHNIQIIKKKVIEIDHEDGYLKKITFEDQSSKSFDAVYASVPFSQSIDLPQRLGCEITDAGYIKTDEMQKTSVAGIYACGDNTTPIRSVANAVYTGNVAGAASNMELTKEQF